MTGSDFDARTYWEERLAQGYSLTGVGFRRLGPSVNTWAPGLSEGQFRTG